MNKQEAEELLQISRTKIDQFDKEIINLIIKRTALAKDIVKSKQVLGMDILDSSREEIIHNKIQKITVNKNIDTDKVITIIGLLAEMNKEEQKKYLE